MDVDVEGAGGDDEFLACDDFCRRANDESGVDSGHDIWVSGFSNANDVTTFDTDICLQNPLANDLVRKGHWIEYLVDS